MDHHDRNPASFPCLSPQFVATISVLVTTFSRTVCFSSPLDPSYPWTQKLLILLQNITERKIRLECGSNDKILTVILSLVGFQSGCVECLDQGCSWGVELESDEKKPTREGNSDSGEQLRI
ncbi:hypothetical protein M758_10G076400 [Ceratodon purpureus]|nr:hypothetical protein M758_10G076400 [Ceratodon purpureus]